jgi:hypothetical protein
VRPEFGIAGRVTDAAGKMLGGLRVEIVDAQGRPAGTTVTDGFGLYRIDGLPIGRYRLSLDAGELFAPKVDSPERRSEIRDDFLFDQNLRLPFVLEQLPNPSKVS